LLLFYDKTTWTCGQGDSQEDSFTVEGFNEDAADQVAAAIRHGI